MKRLILSCVLMANLSTAAYAQGSNSQGWEFGADLIYQDTADLTFEGGSTATLDDDFGIALVFGYRFNENLGLGFSFDWQEADYDVAVRSSLTPGLEFTGSADLETFTPRIWLNYNFTKGNISPYLNAGVGWAFVDTNIPNSRVQVGCWWDPWYGQICAPYQSTKSVDDFVYQAGVGVRWDVSPGYALRLAYEKHWFDYGKATSTPDFDQWKLGLTFRY